MITKISVLSALLAIAAASVITVQVAPDGPVFTPATVTAKKGDVVSFIFKTPNTCVVASLALSRELGLNKYCLNLN